MICQLDHCVELLEYQFILNRLITTMFHSTLHKDNLTNLPLLEVNNQNLKYYFSSRILPLEYIQKYIYNSPNNSRELIQS